MTQSQPSQNDDNNNDDNVSIQEIEEEDKELSKQPVNNNNNNTATETPKQPPLVIVDGRRDPELIEKIEPVTKEDLSGRDISQNPINYAIDSTEDEFKPSKISRLRQFVLDEVTRHFNIDPLGEDYIMIIATSADKGQSFKCVADSTEDQHYIGQEVWAKKMVEKQVMELKRNETELINQAKEILKQEEAGQR